MARKLARLEGALALAVETLASHRVSTARKGYAARGRAAPQSWRAGCPVASLPDARQLEGGRKSARLTASSKSSTVLLIRLARGASLLRASDRASAIGQAALTGVLEGGLHPPCSPSARRREPLPKGSVARSRRRFPVRKREGSTGTPESAERQRQPFRST